MNEANSRRGNKRWTIRWSHGEAELQTAAGMLTRCRFDLPNGPFEPFATAPWTLRDEYPALPGHLRHLGAEFVALPFGCGGPLQGVAPAWRGVIGAEATIPNHGPAANDDWRFVKTGPAAARLSLDYPEDHPIRRLERRVSGIPGKPALALSLGVEARRDCRMPVGLHPILRLPESPGALRIEADFAFGATYPGIVPPGSMASLPGERFARLDAVPGPDGPVDLSRLPLGRPVEDVVQLCGVTAPMRAVFAEAGAALVIDWDRSRLPSALIWLSDRALTEPPFEGRYRGLGLEPIASAFDCAVAVSCGPNPLNASGIPTALTLKAGETVEICCELSAEAAGPGT